MKQRLMRRIATLPTCVGLFVSAPVVPPVLAQEISAPPYQNPGLSPEVRATDLVHRMTLEERASQLINQARDSRLKIPAYDWWSESLQTYAANHLSLSLC